MFVGPATLKLRNGLLRSRADANEFRARGLTALSEAVECYTEDVPLLSFQDNLLRYMTGKGGGKMNNRLTC